MTLCNSKLPHISKDMYSSNDYRRFAREALVSAAVVNVLAKRKLITDDMVNEGYVKLLEEAA